MGRNNLICGSTILIYPSNTHQITLNSSDMMKKPLLILFSLLLLSACGQYSFSVNENLVYSPPLLFADFQVEDIALQDCIKQTIKDQKITKPDLLEKLNCSSAGIRLLEGIEQFKAIKQLDLSDNSISDIQSLSSLESLHTLYLSNNQLSNITQLFSITTLKVLHINKNDAINCKELKTLTRQWQGVVEQPEHCL